MTFIFPPCPNPSVPVAGTTDRFPVHRIYCVGRNYAEHAREMGANPDREPPFFFTKPADAIVENNVDIPYPSATCNFHHEVELVVALGRSGENITAESAINHVFGYATGIDLTRRDLQANAKKTGRPWDTSKGFDHSAPIAAIHAASEVGHLKKGHIRLSVNGTHRQDGDIADMIWSVPDIIESLSKLYHLMPGDLIFTGTPAGVGPLQTGDTIEAEIEGLQKLTTRIVSAL